MEMLIVCRLSKRDFSKDMTYTFMLDCPLPTKYIIELSHGITSSNLYIWLTFCFWIYILSLRIGLCVYGFHVAHCVSLEQVILLGVCIGWVERIFWPNPLRWVKKNSTQPNPTYHISPTQSNPTYMGRVEPMGLTIFLLLLLLNWVEKKYKY